MRNNLRSTLMIAIGLFSGCGSVGDGSRQAQNEMVPSTIVSPVESKLQPQVPATLQRETLLRGLWVVHSLKCGSIEKEFQKISFHFSDETLNMESGVYSFRIVD